MSGWDTEYVNDLDTVWATVWDSEWVNEREIVVENDRERVIEYTVDEVVCGCILWSLSVV